MIRFEWDPYKDLLNIKKHGVSFSEAQTVFFDEYALLFDDPDHSLNEERFNIIGVSAGDKVCLVTHCYRSECDTIRIISARKANASEKNIYLKHIKGERS